jgi:tetraacyldisaccharide 4'-kinase
MSWLFRCGSIFHRLLYRFEIKKIYRSSAFTIGIGNITAGGTGKTPWTIYLANLLANQLAGQIQAAILTRGYGGKLSRHTPLSLNEQSFSACDVGDEAVLFARRLPQVEVIVCKERAKAAAYAEKKGHKLLLVDDAMQHYGLHQDVQIAIVDAELPFGYGHFLPRGLLRDAPNRLRDVDLVVLHRANEAADIEQVEQRIKQYTDAPCIHSEVCIRAVVTQHGKEIALEKGTKVALFCGIGKPSSFIRLMKREFEVVDTLVVWDHGHIAKEKLLQFEQQARKQGAQILLCTEKDMVKLTSLQMSLEIAAVQIDIAITKGQDILHEQLHAWSEQSR